MSHGNTATGRQIRKELRRQTGHNRDTAELCDLLRSGVLRPEAQ